MMGWRQVPGGWLADLYEPFVRDDRGHDDEADPFAGDPPAWLWPARPADTGGGEPIERARRWIGLSAREIVDELSETELGLTAAEWEKLGEEIGEAKAKEMGP